MNGMVAAYARMNKVSGPEQKERKAKPPSKKITAKKNRSSLFFSENNPIKLNR